MNLVCRARRPLCPCICVPLVAGASALSACVSASTNDVGEGASSEWLFSEDEPAGRQDLGPALTYPGNPLKLGGPLPTRDEILESEDGVGRLAAFLIAQRSDQVRATASGGIATLALHFRH